MHACWTFQHCLVLCVAWPPATPPPPPEACSARGSMTPVHICMPCAPWVTDTPPGGTTSFPLRRALKRIMRILKTAQQKQKQPPHRVWWTALSGLGGRALHGAQAKTASMGRQRLSGATDHNCSSSWLKKPPYQLQRQRAEALSLGHRCLGMMPFAKYKKSIMFIAILILRVNVACRIVILFWNIQLVVSVLVCITGRHSNCVWCV